MEKKLNELRKKIDGVDVEILALLRKRLDVVQKIGLIKKEADVKPLDKKRWGQVVANLEKKAKKLDISKELVSNVWDSIHKEALKIEKLL